MNDVIRIGADSSFVEGGQEIRRDGMVLRTEREGTATYRAGEDRDFSYWRAPRDEGKRDHPLTLLLFAGCGIVFAGAAVYHAEIDAAMRATPAPVRLVLAVAAGATTLLAAWALRTRGR